MSCNEYGDIDRNCGTCSSCQGAYPGIASAFSAVPNNFNGVTNFQPKFPVFDNLQVTRKAVENLQQAGPDDNGLNGSIGTVYENCSVCETESFGFVGYPQVMEAVVVDVCGKASCSTTGVTPPDFSCVEGGCSCSNNNAFCDGFGFTWSQTGARKGYFRAVEACGKIRQDVGCNKDFNPYCNYGPYETVLSCGPDATVTANETTARSLKKKAPKRNAKRAVRAARGGCGCGK